MFCCRANGERVADIPDGVRRTEDQDENRRLTDGTRGVTGAFCIPGYVLPLRITPRLHQLGDLILFGAAQDHKLPGLAVLGRGTEAGRCDQFLHQLVIHRLVPVLPDAATLTNCFH